MLGRFQWLRDLLLEPGLGASFRMGVACGAFIMLCCFWLRLAHFDDWFAAVLLLLSLLALELVSGGRRFRGSCGHVGVCWCPRPADRLLGVPFLAGPASFRPVSLLPRTVLNGW